MLRRNPRQDAPRSPTCPTSQPCLRSRNPGHTEEYIRGRARLRGQEGERVCVSAKGAGAQEGFWELLPGLPRAAQCSRGWGCRSWEPHALTEQLSWYPVDPPHTPGRLPGPVPREGQWGGHHQDRLTPPQERLGQGASWAGSLRRELCARPQVLGKAREEPWILPSSSCAALAPVVPSSPDAKCQQQWKEGVLKHGSIPRTRAGPTVRTREACGCQEPRPAPPGRRRCCHLPGGSSTRLVEGWSGCWMGPQFLRMVS